jgi:hypothetical protein
MFLSINDALVIVGLLLTSFQGLNKLKIPKELKILNSPPPPNEVCGCQSTLVGFGDLNKFRSKL